MTLIRNSNTVYGYTGEDWAKGSVWTFRREQTSDDRDSVQLMTTKNIVKGLDRRKIKDMLKKGESIEDYIGEHTDTTVQMSTEKAMLGVMSVKVEGPDFTYPTDYIDENGKLSPLAGKPMPQPPPLSLKRRDPAQYSADLDRFINCLGSIDPDERSDVMRFMSAVWAGGNPEELKNFRQSSVGVAESGDRGKR